jgi:hypothetical protein
MSCEVLDGQVELRFGDQTGGLHLFLDMPGFVKLVRLEWLVVKRYNALAAGARVAFVVGDDDGGPNESVGTG